MRVIYYDEFDDHAWQDALSASGSLRALIDRSEDHGELFEDLLADVFQLLLQPAPRWLKPARPTLHEYVLREASDTHEFRALRAMSEGDAANATMATAIIGRQALSRLDRQVGEGLLEEMKRHRALASATADEAVYTEALRGEPDDQGGAAAACEAALQRAVRARTAAEEAVDDLPRPETLDAGVHLLRREFRDAAVSAIAEVQRIDEAERIFGRAGNGSLEAKLRLAERLGRSTRLAELVELTGRMRRIAFQKRASIIREAREAIIGVTMGDDPARALPSELALLAAPGTRALFYRKMVEGQLLQHEQQAEERLGGGPIVICLDGSGSMAGAKELWSKAVVLAYLAVAERERRDVILCQFGDVGQQRVFSFPYRTAIREVRREDVLEAVECFLDGGGTDLEGPLRWAAAQIRPPEGPYARADVVALTDAETTFSPAFLDWWRAERARLGFHTFGVLIGSPAAAAVLAQAIEHVAQLDDLAADDHALATLFG